MKIKKSETELLKSYIIEAFNLLLAHKRFTEITIKEITTKAGVNRSTYYRNFDSKEDIIKQFYTGLLDQCVAKQPTDIKSHLFIIFNHFLKYKKELISLHENHLSYHLLGVLNQYFSDFKHHQISNLEDDFDVFYHTGGIFNIFYLWFDLKMDTNPNTLVQKSLAILPTDFKPMLSRNKIKE